MKFLFLVLTCCIAQYTYTFEDRLFPLLIADKEGDKNTAEPLWGPKHCEIA